MLGQDEVAVAELVPEVAVLERLPVAVVEELLVRERAQELKV